MRTRTLLTLPLLLVASGPRAAEADCVDPYSCICSYGAPGFYEATVVGDAGATERPQIRIDAVHRPENLASPYGVQEQVEGPDLNVAVTAGQRLLLEADGDGAFTTITGPVIADAQGTVRCLFNPDFSVTYAQAVMAATSDDCVGELNALGFEPPECNDVVSGCNCRATHPRSGSGAWATCIALSTIGVLRRSRRR